MTPSPTALNLAAPNFLPIIKPRNWRGRKHSVCRRLVRLEDGNVPLVTYGWDAPDQVEYLTRQALEEATDCDLKAVDRQARRNLRRHAERGEWELESPQDGIEFLIREGEYAASALLLRREMRKAHEMLNSDLLVVGVPSRFCIWVCEVGLAPMMMSLAREQHRAAARDGAEPVTPELLFLQDGRIEGMASPQDASHPDPDLNEEATWERRWRLDPDNGELIIDVACQGLDHFIQAFGFEMDAVTSSLDLEGFSGRVLLCVDGVPKNQETERVLRDLQQRSQQLVRENDLCTPAGDPLELRIRFGAFPG